MINIEKLKSRGIQINKPFIAHNKKTNSRYIYKVVDTKGEHLQQLTFYGAEMQINNEGIVLNEILSDNYKLEAI